MAERNHEGTGRYSGTSTKVDSLMDELFEELKKYNGGAEAGTPAPTPMRSKVDELGPPPVDLLTEEPGAMTEDVELGVAEDAAEKDTAEVLDILMKSAWDTESLQVALNEAGITAEEALNIYPIGEEGPEALIESLRELAGMSSLRGEE